MATTPITATPSSTDATTTNPYLQFFNSPAGQSVIGAAGGALTAYGQAQQQSANREQNALEYAATSRQTQYNADRQDQAARASGVLNADPLGADQMFAQRNALLSAILPQLRNGRSTPGDAGVASAMGTRTGGLSNIIPQGGFDPAMIDRMFGDATTANSIAQRHMNLSNLDPNAAQPNLTSMYGSTGAGPQQTVANWANQLQTLRGQDRAKFEADMNNYINQMVQQEQEGGFWHKFAKVAAIVGAAAATYFTAGAASPLLGAAIGMGSGALNAWADGGSPVMGAVMGGASGYLGNRIPQTTGQVQDLRVNH